MHPTRRVHVFALALVASSLALARAGGSLAAMLLSFANGFTFAAALVLEDPPGPAARRYVYQAGRQGHPGPRVSVTAEPGRRLGFLVTGVDGTDGPLIDVDASRPCYVICELVPLGAGRWKTRIDMNGEGPPVESDTFAIDMGDTPFELAQTLNADLSHANGTQVTIAEVVIARGPVPDGKHDELRAYFRTRYGVGR
jgi:hypothetical protein